MKRFGFFALAALVMAAPASVTAQVDPLGLIPAVKAAAPKLTPVAAPASCGNSRIPFLPSFGPVPAGYAPAVLWPDDGQCANYFRELKFSAAAAQKKAFDTASRVPCTACEGGHSYDSWANYYTEKDGSKPAFEAKLTALPIGKSITWTGKKYKGVVVATGSHPIGTTPCRQYHWTLTAAGKVTAEREGLYCQIGGRWVEMV